MDRTSDRRLSAPDIDAYTPARIAARVAEIGVAKAELDAGRTFALAILAGIFTGFGSAFFTFAAAAPWDSIIAARLAGGLAFCLGLILVVVAGAELFIGNNLVAMAWAEGEVATGTLGRNWALVYFGNFIGAVGLAVLLALSGTWGASEGAVARAAVEIAAEKAALPFSEAFVRGILCNMLVCFAIWLCMAARGVMDKVLAIVFPITATAAIGFEHSVANMYFLAAGFLAGGEGMSLAGALRNLAAATAGNIVGGTGMVAMVFWWVYLRK